MSKYQILSIDRRIAYLFNFDALMYHINILILFILRVERSIVGLKNNINDLKYAGKGQIK